MNKSQKLVIAISLPLLAIFIGFAVIGADGSIQARNMGGIEAQVFNPFHYFYLHGYKWAVVVVVTTILEVLLWRSPKIGAK